MTPGLLPTFLLAALSKRMSSEAIRDGMLRARASGVRLGRPPAATDAAIEELLRAGWPAVRVRKHLKVGTATVRKVVARIKGEQA